MEIFFNFIIAFFLVLIFIQLFKIKNKEYFKCDISASSGDCFKKHQAENNELISESEKKYKKLQKKMDDVEKLYNSNTNTIFSNTKIINDLK